MRPGFSPRANLLDFYGTVVQDDEVIVTSQDCRAYKPRADMFEKALALLDLPADQVLHVGDSYGSDVRGARSVGIPVLWINRKKRPLPLGHEAPDCVSEDLTGLLSIV